MIKKTKMPMLYWSILTFNKENEFPPERKVYYLDWAKLNKEQILDVLSIISSNKFDNIKIEKEGLPVCDNINFTPPNHRNYRVQRKIIEYRKHFIPSSMDKILQMEYSRLQPVNVDNYFENYKGKRVCITKNINGDKTISPYVFPKSNSITLGGLHCILALGNSAMKNKDKWMQKDTDTVAHFLQAYEAIHDSSIIKNYQPRITTNENGDTLHCDIPTMESIVYILVLFRQMIEEKLFQQAVSRYRKFVDCEHKKCWVEWERDEFLHFLNECPMQVSIKPMGIDNRQLLDAFFYGSLIAHTDRKVTDKNNIQVFESLYNLPNKEEAIWALWECLQRLARHLSNVAGLIYYDFAYWLETEDILKPSVCWQKNMFTWSKS